MARGRQRDQASLGERLEALSQVGRDYGYGERRQDPLERMQRDPGWWFADEHLRLGAPDMPRGQHLGKGPRGYRRSDETLLDDVNLGLTVHPGVDATNVSVQVEGGVVTLSGSVRDRAQKYAAEDAAFEVLGVQDVLNQLRVTPRGEEPRR